MKPACPPLPPIPDGMDWENFRREGHKVIDFIADYYQSLKNRSIPPQSDVKPGYLKEVFPQLEAPLKPSGEFDSILSDIQQHIVPGMTHWQHPDFYAWFPAQVSPAALLGDTIASSLNQPGFNWLASPAATELEVIVMEWVARAMGLPSSMLWESGSGGGVMQPSATEAAIVALLAAKGRALEAYTDPEAKGAAAAKLVCYVSDQAHFCVQKACRVLSIPHVRAIATQRLPDGNCPMMAEDVQKAVQEDIAKGLIPCMISVNYGTTGVCAVDDFEGIAAVCKQHNIWMNLDCAYAGATAFCPEMRAPLLPAFENVDSLFVNGSKWLSLMMNCSFFFFKDRRHVVSSLNATGVYLSNKFSDSGSVVDFKDYHLGLGRPFRALKVFTALRYMGVEGVQTTIRRHCALAKYLYDLLRADEGDLFELPIEAKFGLVCFRLKNDPDNARTRALLAKLQDEKRYMLVHHELDGRVLIRVALAWPGLAEKDMEDFAAYLSEKAKAV